MSYRYGNARFGTEEALASEIASSFLYGASNRVAKVAQFDVDVSIADLHRECPLDDVAEENDIPLDQLKEEVECAVGEIIEEAKARVAATREIDPPRISLSNYGDELAPLCVVKETFVDHDPFFYPAYIDIDTDSGEVEGSYNPESGEPERIHRECVIRISVPADVSGKALEKYLESDTFLALYQRIKAGHTIEWDDSLFPIPDWQRQRGHLDDDAREAVEQVETAIDDLSRATICEVPQAVAIHFDGEITADTTDDELRAMAREFRENALESGTALVGGDVLGELIDLRGRIAGDDNEDDGEED